MISTGVTVPIPSVNILSTTPTLSIISRNELPSFSRFVYEVYASNNAGDLDWEPNEQEIQEFITEDENYFPNSLYVGFKVMGETLISTLKITQYQSHLTFPIQKEFGIAPEEIAQRYRLSPDQLFHLGRLCVAKNRLPVNGPNSRELFTRMLYRCLFFTTWVPQGHIFAEAAEPAVHLFETIGCPMDLLGEPRFHTGTYTYPVVISASAIRQWLHQHQDLT